jgi:hypothetical protein
MQRRPLRWKGQAMGTPNHPPFSEWLLSGEPLTPEQKHNLHDHVQSCPACSQLQSSLFDVRHQFKTSGQAAPAPGFTDRWRERLVEQRLKRQRRSAWILFFFAAVMAVGLLGVISWQVLEVMTSPISILSAMVYFWTVTLVTVDGFKSMLWSFGQLVPSISTMGILLFFGFFSLMSALWLVTYRQLTTMRRVPA